MSQSVKSPISDCLFDIIAVMHAKGKGLEAYEKYLADAKGEDEELASLLDRLKQQDTEALIELKTCLAKFTQEVDDDEGGSIMRSGTIDDEPTGNFSPTH